jgi:hypothetical protein
VAFYLVGGTTWRLLSGRGARRERPAGRGQVELMGLRQRADERGSLSLVRGQGRERSVGSGRGHQLNARQVFDVTTPTRARSRGAERNGTRS